MSTSDHCFGYWRKTGHSKGHLWLLSLSSVHAPAWVTNAHRIFKRVPILDGVPPSKRTPPAMRHISSLSLSKSPQEYLHACLPSWQQQLLLQRCCLLLWHTKGCSHWFQSSLDPAVTSSGHSAAPANNSGHVCPIRFPKLLLHGVSSKFGLQLACCL